MSFDPWVGARFLGLLLLRFMGGPFGLRDFTPGPHKSHRSAETTGEVVPDHVENCQHKDSA